MATRRMEKHVANWNGQKIKQLRNRFDESQNEFCQRLGVTVDALQHWEQDRSGPSRPIEILLDMLEEHISCGRFPPVPVFTSPESKKIKASRKQLAGTK